MNRNAVHGLLGLTLFGVIRLAVAWNERLDVAALQAWIESAGAAAPLVLIAAYAAVTVLFSVVLTVVRHKQLKCLLMPGSLMHYL